MERRGLPSRNRGENTVQQAWRAIQVASGSFRRCLPANGSSFAGSGTRATPSLRRPSMLALGLRRWRIALFMRRDFCDQVAADMQLRRIDVRIDHYPLNRTGVRHHMYQRRLRAAQSDQGVSFRRLDGVEETLASG